MTRKYSSIRKFAPGNVSTASRMIRYTAVFNALFPNTNSLNCTCIPDSYDKFIPGSDSGSYKIPRGIWHSHIIRTSLGGSTQYGNNYLGETLNLNYLGNPQGMPGGSGIPPKNRF
jgi:hypothetical protein